MSHKMKKVFNEFEEEIHNICFKEEVDYDRIDYLLKHGASANAREITEWEDGEVEEDLLLTQCWNDGRARFNDDGSRKLDDDFCLKLLEIFIDNGLDVDKYVNNIFSNIQWTYDDKNFVDMTKLILNNIKDKSSINLESSLDGIGTEESYNNCCTQDHKYANVLSTIYEMIDDYYNKDSDPNKFYSCDKILNQDIKNIRIFCNDIKVDQPKNFICDNIDIFVECEKNILCIKNKYIYVNDNEIMSEYEPLGETSSVTKDNEFGHSLQEYANGEKIVDITFIDSPISRAPKTTIHSTVITLKLTNNKEIKIKTDETGNYMKVIIK